MTHGPGLDVLPDLAELLATQLVPSLGHPPHLGWRGLLTAYDGVAVVVALALPVGVLAVWALARRRRRGGSEAMRAWCRSSAEVALVVGTLPGLWVTMVPGSRAGTVPGRVSLVPLQDLGTMSAYQVVGNLMILAALGFLVPLRFPVLATLPRTLTLAAACSVLIETLQYVLRLDRVSSIDDVLLNTAGAGLAALRSLPWWWPSGAPESGVRRAAAENARARAS